MEFPLHWLIILLVIVLLFGGRKIPEVMRGLGEGIRNFKDGMRGDHTTQPNQTTTTSTGAPVTTSTPTPSDEKK